MSYTPVIPSAMTLLSSITIANQLNVDLPLTAGFSQYVVQLRDIVPSLDDVNLLMRFSQDGGTTVETSGIAYDWVHHTIFLGGAGQFGAAAQDNRILLTSNLLNRRMGIAVDETLNATIHIYNPDQVGNTITGRADVSLKDSSHVAASLSVLFAMQPVLVANANVVRVNADVGNLNTGVATVYGIAK